MAMLLAVSSGALWTLLVLLLFGGLYLVQSQPVCPSTRKRAGVWFVLSGLVLWAFLHVSDVVLRHI